MVKPFVTLRNVQKGWNASQELRALLESRRQRGEAYTQDWLADEAGLKREQVNGFVTGRTRMGRRSAERLAAALGVTLLELGAPEGEDDGRGKPLLDLLQELRAVVDAQQKTLDSQARSIQRMQSRLRALEQDSATPQPAGGAR